MLGLEDFINQKWTVEQDRLEGKLVGSRSAVSWKPVERQYGRVQKTFWYKSLETRKKVLTALTLPHSAITHCDSFVKCHCGELGRLNFSEFPFC